MVKITTLKIKKFRVELVSLEFNELSRQRLQLEQKRLVEPNQRTHWVDKF
jgi:hypothetical protein